MSLSEFLKSVVGILDEARIPYMLTGSLAAAFYSVPRATRDVDIVLETEPGGIDRVVDGLQRAGFYVDRDTAHEAWRTRSQFNAIDPEHGWKVDLIVRKERAFSREEFARRQRASILGIEISLARVEDVLLAKLEWAKLGDSELQLRDAVQLVERAGKTLERAYLKRWIKELELESQWQTVERRAVPEPRREEQ